MQKKKLSEEDLYKVMKTMPQNKSPGNDDLTNDFGMNLRDHLKITFEDHLSLFQWK